MAAHGRRPMNAGTRKNGGDGTGPPGGSPGTVQKEDRKCRCRFCGSDSIEFFQAFDFYAEPPVPYLYFECDECRSLQAVGMPKSPESLYGHDYYSFDHSTKGRLSALVRGVVDSARVCRALGGAGALGALVEPFSRPLDYLEWVKIAGVSQADRILDVGCGTGKLVERMRLGGFRNAIGIDPFLDSDVTVRGEPVALKRKLSEFAATTAISYDFIMFNHSLEHVNAPGRELEIAGSILARGGTIMVRLPVADNHVWREYGSYWYGLRPPQHVSIPSVTGMKALSRSLGLETERVVFEEHPEHLLITEARQRGVYGPIDTRVMMKSLDDDELRRIRQKEHEAAMAGLACCAAFFLRRSGEYRSSGHSGEEPGD